MANLYAVWKKEDGALTYNPNCHFTQHAVGDVVNGSECVLVGSLDECSAMVKKYEQEQAPVDFLDNLFK